ncbi:hypothetical protein [Mycobacterium sp. DBP42]|uniref:hypothetical protein n=1 Tax=Mycobacterium sp. DBP42 TaxID=2545267 RepID=UPI00110C94AF|nr:hypothetical protein [Mycobacterium sp. DBP42]TMS54384.1 hypothetical protein E0T84_06070 [Mycobacterium sp. DBP42]
MEMTKHDIGELTLGAGALAMAVGAFAGHLLAPRRVADHYGWVHDRWYQREIGAFNAGLGYGIVAYATGRKAKAFLGSWSVAALLVAMTRLAAIRSGDRGGFWNMATVAEDAALGVGGLLLMVRRA